MPQKHKLIFAAAITLILTSCASSQTPEVPEPTKEPIVGQAVMFNCADPFMDLAEILATNSEPTYQEEILYAKSLRVCDSLQQWSSAAEQNPMALGFERITAQRAADMVYIDCFKHDPDLQTPVCADAKEKKYLD